MASQVAPVVKNLSANAGNVKEVGSIPGQMSGQVSRGSAGEYQAVERAGVARLSWRRGGFHPRSPVISPVEPRFH